MGWLQIAGYVLQIVLWILNATKEKNDELKKKKTEALQSGLRGIIDRDSSRVTLEFDRLNRLR